MDFVDDIDFADDGWSRAAPDGDADGLDDLFAQLEDVGELLPIRLGHES